MLTVIHRILSAVFPYGLGVVFLFVLISGWLFQESAAITPGSPAGGIAMAKLAAVGAQGTPDAQNASGHIPSWGAVPFWNAEKAQTWFVEAVSQGPSQSEREIINEKMIRAVADGDLQQIQNLLSTGANVNAKDKDGETALMLAARDGRLEVVDLLLDKGARVDEKNKFHSTALMQASYNVHTEIVKLLLEKGANVNAKNLYGITPLMLAANEKEAPLVEALVQAGADVNARDSEGSTALMRASGQGTLQVVKLLIERGAQVDEQNTLGSTALMAAAYHGMAEIVSLLIRKGANVNAKNSRGFTPLDFALSSIGGDPDTIELLRSKGVLGSAEGVGYEQLGIQFKEHWGNGGAEHNRLFPLAK